MICEFCNYNSNDCKIFNEHLKSKTHCINISTIISVLFINRKLEFHNRLNEILNSTDFSFEICRYIYLSELPKYIDCFDDDNLINFIEYVKKKVLKEKEVEK